MSRQFVRHATILRASVACPNGGGRECYSCVSMCESRPCWLSPDEAEAMMAAGDHDKRLMLDWWSRSGDDIELLGAAIRGYEAARAPWMPVGACTFLTRKGLCELHVAGLKPIEGRAASCTDEGLGNLLHYSVARLWDNAHGRRVIAAWKAKFIGEVAP